MKTLQSLIETAYESREHLSPSAADPALIKAINQVLHALESGTLCVSEKQQGQWITHAWIKKAILLYFALHKSTPITGGFTQFHDKIPLRFTDTTDEEWKDLGIRLVPPATVRRGAYLGPHTVLMPSFINIGAHVGSGSMIDTWATVGSCAYIGKQVHLSGGVGIGGVLEPLQSRPTIIEDHCFIGARSEIVEGVIVEQGCVISMGVYIGQSTRIYDRQTQEISYGRVPANSVVVSGTLPSSTGDCSLYAAIIVKKVDEKTRAKIPINELLRIE